MLIYATLVLIFSVKKALENMLALVCVCVFIVFVGMSCFFAACETAITAASRAKFHHLAKEGSHRAQMIVNLQAQMGLVINVLLTLNTLINAGAVSLATSMALDMLGEKWMALVSLSIGFFIVVYVEIMPKMAALLDPERFLMAAAPILNALLTVFRPLTRVLNSWAKWNLRLMGARTGAVDQAYASIEEVRGVIDLHKGPGQDVEDERAMLKSILDLGRVQVGHIMTHRQNVTMINAGDSMTSIIDQVLNCPYTRIPVWEGEVENIIGIIRAKDLWRIVQYYPGDLNSLKIRDLVSPPWFVPESTDLLEQLNAFQKRREHFGLVVDEYGALMGIVTLEDILEEIVGDITDEHDIAVKGIIPQSDGSYLVNGSVTLRDLNRQFHWDLPDEGVTAATVAGLLLYSFRLIPEEGQTFVFPGFRFDVLKRKRNQITLIRITKEDTPTPQNGGK